MTLKQVADNHGLTPEGVDYALRQYQIVISEITHGLLSKLSYDAHDVLRCAQERWCDTCELKAQEPKKLRCIRRLTKVMKGICPVCEMEIESVIHGRITKFCKFCGQEVKWNDPD